MALFGILKKKKKEEELPPPPPPSPPELPSVLRGEIEEIRPRGAEVEMPMPPPPPAGLPPPPKPPLPPEAPAPPLPPMPHEEVEMPPFEVEEVHEELPEIHERLEVPEEAPERIVRPAAGPVFVSTEDYKRVTADSDAIRAKLMKAEDFVKKLGDLKNEEEKVFDKWRNYLEALEKKLDYVDKLIAKAQG